METIEGNKLIAEFMGAVHDKEAGTYNYKDYKNFSPKNMAYHSSWDWLMPVLEKIASTKLYYFEVSARTCSIKGTNGRPSPDVYGSGKTTIEATWEAATEFIDWYNATDYLRTT